DNRAARPGDDRDPAAAVPEWCRTGCVGADEVALDDVPDGIRAGDDDPLQPVAGDHVAGGGARAADRVPACLEDPDAGPVLASRAAADQVPLDEVPGRAGVGEVDAVVRVAIDDVARPGGAAADDVRGGAARDRDAVAAPADVVALDGVRRGSGAVDRDADGIRPDRVERGPRGPADRVPRRAQCDADAGDAVRSRGAVRGRSDRVPLDGVAARPGVGEEDAVPVVPGDEVAGPRRRAADDVAGGAPADPDAVELVAEAGGRRPGSSDADIVAVDDGAGRSPAVDLDAPVGVAGDHVPGARAR